VAEIVSTTGDFYNAVQDEDVRRRDELREARQKTEVEVFDEKGLSYRKYCERRDGARFMYLDPETPQDEMDYRDFRLSREEDTGLSGLQLSRRKIK
jgi:hypothetical protein